MNNKTVQCIDCHKFMELWNRQFYCCDRNDRYCLKCKLKGCPKCLKAITKEYQEPRCQECLTPYGDMYYESLCDKHFCSKCLITRVMKQNIQNSHYLLPCGHQVEREKLKTFVKGKYCFLCGASTKDTDYDLINDEKCCFNCVKYEGKKVECFLLGCLGCGNTLKKLEEVGKMDDGFILCKSCVKESELEENRHHQEHEEKKTVEENLKNLKICEDLASDKHFKEGYQRSNVQNEHMIANKNELTNYSVNIVPPPNAKINNVSLENVQNNRGFESHSFEPINLKTSSAIMNANIPPNKTQKDVNFHEGDANMRKSNSFDNNSIKQGDSLIIIDPIKEKKEINPVQSPTVGNSSSKIVKNLSKSSSKNSNDSSYKTVLEKFPEEKEEEENRQKCRLKKHLSIDTYVEKMKINIEKENCPLINCNECEYEILESESFSIENYEKINKPYCRLCYVFLTNSQSLGFHLQQTKLDVSRNRRGASNQKVNQPYSPGKSMPAGTPFLSTQPETNHMKLSATNFDHQQRVTTTNSQNARVIGSGFKGQECVVCKEVGKSTIYTANGNYCISCYHKRK